MQIDQPLEAPQSSIESNQTIEIPPSLTHPEDTALKTQPEEHNNNGATFFSAKDCLPKVVTVDETSQVQASLKTERSALDKPVKEIVEKAEVVATAGDPHDSNDMNIVENELDEELVVDESRSPSQGSSPAKPLVRKSSLTFAALPAREPLTTKKSIGARVSRTSQLDQNKPILGRSSFLDRFAGNKSLETSRQADGSVEKDDDGNMTVDTEPPHLSRDESDLDSKITKLHNKSSTQRLQDKINMLGKTQNVRNTKSISATAAPAGPTYPLLPDPEPPSDNLQQIAGMASKALAAQNDEEDEDWIQSPGIQIGPSKRPQLAKSITADVMENIKGKQTIGGSEFSDKQSREQPMRLSPSRQETGGEAHPDVSDSSRVILYPRFDTTDCNDGEWAKAQTTSTTPVGSPSSKRYVDGPLSASKSKLQSIMKTARGLFSSSAGVSAQAKIETMSPSTKTRAPKQYQETEAYSKFASQTPQLHSMQNPVDRSVGRKTRSSTEKEEKRKQSEAEQHAKGSVENAEGLEQSIEPKGTKQQRLSKGPLMEVSQQSAKPTRQSPRRMQAQEASRARKHTSESEPSTQPMGPPPPNAQGQQSQLQKPKDGRRPIKPAKETIPKPKPQPVAIRVMSQGLRMNNTALSSGLQDSLPPSQSKQPTISKKPSSASIHSTVSNSSLKSSANSISSKPPKALLAAEKKKEQVCCCSRSILVLDIDVE